MICPNKNTKEWKDLVSKVGEDRAYAIWQIRDLNDFSSDPPSETLLDYISKEVSTNYEYYKEAYKDLFALNRVRNVDEAVKMFYSRVSKYEGAMWNTSYATDSDGNKVSLFPSTTFKHIKGKDVTKSELLYYLNKLKSKFGYDYIVIDDPLKLYKGKNTLIDGRRIMVVNIAYATADTPFHEYYHPFVRDIKEQNPTLYAKLAETVDVDVDAIDAEEYIVNYLSTKIASRQTSGIVGQFIDYIKYLFAKLFPTSAKKITELSTLGDVMDILNSKAYVSTEATSLEEAYSLADMLKKLSKGEAHESFKDTRADPSKDLIGEIIKKSKDNPYTTDDTSTVYTGKDGSEVTRLTSFIGDDKEGKFSLKYQNREKTYAEYEVDRIYKSRGIATDQPLTQKNALGVLVQISYEELVNSIQQEIDKRKTYGKVVHSLINYLLETDRDRIAEAKKDLLKYAKQYGINSPSPELSSEFRIYTENIDKIVASLNLRFELDDDIKVTNPDRIAPEVTIVSDLLKLGTTADGIVQHFNGELSMFDWKTGDIMKDYNSSLMMAYGKKFNVNDSKLSKAKLEMAFRALIIKESHPEAKFRDITVVRLNSQGEAKAYKVDLEPYLGMVGEYYKENDPTVYKSLVEKGLLNSSSYLGTPSEILDVYDSIKGLPLDQQIAVVQEQLNDITLRYTKEELEGLDYLKERRAKLTKALLELNKIPTVNLEEDTPDVDSLRGQFKNLSDISNRYIQTLHKVKLEKDHSMRKELDEIDNEHRNLLSAVLLEQNHSNQDVVRGALKFLAGAALLYTSPWAIPAIFITNYVIDKVGKSTFDTWSFMWSQSKETANPGWFLNTTDIDTNTGKPLTAAQKAYRSFVVNTMKSKWKEVMGEVVHYRGKYPVTKAEYYGMPLELADDFLPRVFRSTKEIREQQALFPSEGEMGIGEGVKDWGRRHIGNFFTEIEHGEEGKGGIPVQFYAHYGNAVVTSVNHSFNVEKAFSGFMGSLVKKKYYDDLLAMAEGTKNCLELSKSDLGGPKYKKLAAWLDDQIYLQFLNKPKPTSLTTKEVTLPVNATIGKILGIPPGDYKIPAEKLLRLIKSALSMSVMGFKIIGATFNGALITFMNGSQIFKHRISGWLGVPPDDYEPDEKAVVGALADMRDFYKHSIKGTPHNSKLWRLAELSGWVPDNYDFARTNKNLLSSSQSLDFGSYAYMFHNFVETYGAMWHLGIMLRSARFKDDQGKTYTAWDGYSLNEKNELVWNKGVRGKVEVAPGVFKELEELDSLEWKTMKRAYEKLHGSYRQEEKVALESTIWGEFVLQFKRYFPTYMKNLWASPFKDITVGKYVLDGNITKPGDVSTFKWEEQVMEGRYRVLASSIMAAGLSKEKWAALDTNRRRHLAALLNTGLWFMLAYIFLSPDKDEKDTYAAWRWSRLVEDVSQGAKITDMLHALDKPVIVLTRASQIYQAMWDATGDIVTGDRSRSGQIRGAKTIVSSVPPFSNWYQMQQMANSAKMDKDYLFGIIPVTNYFESNNR